MDETPKTDGQDGPVKLPENAVQSETPQMPPTPPDATIESFNRLKPVARAIIQLVYEKAPAIGNNTNEEDDFYFKLAEEVLGFMRDNKVKYMEKESLFQLLLQPFDKIRTIVMSSLNKSANKAVDLRMGKQFGEVTLADLDEILKSEVIPHQE